MPEAILVEKSAERTFIKLNRPDKLNAFNATIVQELLEAVQSAKRDGTRLLVFNGEGKGFSGGFDLSDLKAVSDDDLLQRFVKVEELLQAVYYSPLSTVALVHGPCYGAAADLVAACKWRLATPEARFRMPGLRFGIVLGTGRLGNLVGSDNARTLLLHDKPFGSEEALSKGFITEICEQENWSQSLAQIQHHSTALSSHAFGAMSARLTEDTREADMEALIQSVKNRSIKDRITAYLEEIKATKK